MLSIPQALLHRKTVPANDLVYLFLHFTHKILPIIWNLCGSDSIVKLYVIILCQTTEAHATVHVLGILECKAMLIVDEFHQQT